MCLVVDQFFSSGDAQPGAKFMMWTRDLVRAAVTSLSRHVHGRRVLEYLDLSDGVSDIVRALMSAQSEVSIFCDYFVAVSKPCADSMRFIIVFFCLADS